jgi:hypothetical protein
MDLSVFPEGNDFDFAVMVWMLRDIRVFARLTGGSAYCRAFVSRSPNLRPSHLGVVGA